MRSNLHTARAARSPSLAIVLVLMFVCSLVPMAARQQALDPGGSPLDPFKEARGKVVVLVFVRTDCPISNRYAPLIQELSAKYAHEAAVWLVFPDRTASPKNIRAYLHEYGYKLPALRDAEHAWVEKSRVKVTPEAAVFNTKRELVYHGRIDNLYQDFGKARRAATTHELADAIEAASKGVSPRTAWVDGIGCFIADLR